MHRTENKTNWLNWSLCLTVAIASQIVSKLYFPIPDIIKLEFSSSAAILQDNINAISFSPERSYSILKYNTIIDFVFIAAFTLLTYYSGKIILASINYPMKLWMIILCGATGFFDIIEDYFLLSSALEHGANFSMIYFWAVRIKWAFSVVPIVLVPTAILYGLVKLLRRQQQLR
jgi:hypothetical protein